MDGLGDALIDEAVEPDLLWLNAPLMDKFFPPSLPPFNLPVLCVEEDETESSSELSSLPPPPNRPDVVEDDLFFLGTGERTLPGISSRSCL